MTCAGGLSYICRTVQRLASSVLIQTDAVTYNDNQDGAFTGGVQHQRSTAEKSDGGKREQLGDQ